jgi:hypothetical protein
MRPGHSWLRGRLGSRMTKQPHQLRRANIGRMHTNGISRVASSTARALSPSRLAAPTIARNV